MKRLVARLAIAATLALTVTLVTVPVAAHPSIDITASNWKFTPGTITLHVGETTQLRLTTTEGVHGIKSDELGIPLTAIPPGSFVTVSVTPKKAGTYLLHCAIMCGPGHDKMALTVVVEGTTPIVAMPASVDVVASNWKFTPDAITLHVNQTTQLNLTTSEGVHGIASDDLGIPLTVIPPGKPLALQVTPKKLGTFVLHCAVMCGPGHDKMALTVSVVK